MGRSRRTRTREPPGRRPILARPGDHGRAPPDAKRASWRIGGWRGRAHIHPGGSPRPGASRRSLKLIARPAPPPPPRRGLIFWGVPPAVGIVGPEDPRPKSLQSWREGWGLLWAFSSITCDHCFEAPGSQAHQAIRGPSL